MSDLGVWLDLDEPRNTLVESSFTKTKFGRDINTPFSVLNKSRKWKHGSWTLAPINIASDFGQSPHWESLKFRLTEVDADTEWIQEVPQAFILGFPPKPYDHFFSTVVKAEHYEQPNEFDLLKRLADIANLGAVQLAEMQQRNGVVWIASKAEMPINQGFHIRFFTRGRSTKPTGAMWEFYFGNYMLQCGSTGICRLFAQDFGTGTYKLMDSFRWASPSRAVGGDHHEITIFPHGRNQIEFLFPSPVADAYEAIEGGVRRIPGYMGHGSHVFTLPVEPELTAEGGDPIITAAAKWYLWIDRGYRHFVQISKLGFRSGFKRDAFVVDYPEPLSLPPLMPLRLIVHGDKNTGEFSRTLLDYTDGLVFGTLPTHRSPQAVVGLIGKKDVAALNTPNEDWASLRSPEMYSYALDKSAKIERFVPTTAQSTRLMRDAQDKGDAPESERATIVCDNSGGPLSTFQRRAEIPIRVRQRYEVVTGEGSEGVEIRDRTLFEGQVVSVRHNKTRRPTPKLEFEAAGMADRLLRAYPWDLDFTLDPNSDPNEPVRGWYWQDAARSSFEVGGFDKNAEVKFEDVATVVDGAIVYRPASDFNFRLWGDGGSGGTKGGKAKGADGSTPGQRWRPNFKSPIYQFLDYLIRNVMGWHFEWSYVDRAEGQVLPLINGQEPPHHWRVFKRPRPEVVDLLPPRARFMTSSTWADDPLYPGIPTYAHAGMVEETTRPECTTILAMTMLSGPEAVSQSQLDRIIALFGSWFNFGRSGPQLCTFEFDNKNGYRNPQNPVPDETSPDWLMTKRVKPVPIWEASSRDAIEWIGRRAFEDRCFGHVFGNFVADWGDETTSTLRKWDPVLIDGEKFLINRVEPEWRNDRIMRAKYRCSLHRPGVAPPR